MDEERALSAERMDWAELMLSSSGRLSRRAFVPAAAALFALAVLYEAMGPGVHRLTAWFAYPALLFSTACILSKRLHDRGRAGWWAFAVVIPLAIAWPFPRSLIDGVACLVLAWGATDLALMPGEAGANRFGPSPRSQGSS